MRCYPAMVRARSSPLLLDLLAVGDFPLVDAEGEATLWIGAGPRLEDDGRAFLSVIGERDQDPVATLLAFGKLHQPPHAEPTPLCQVVAKIPKLNKRMPRKQAPVGGAPRQCPREESNLYPRLRRPV